MCPPPTPFHGPREGLVRSYMSMPSAINLFNTYWISSTMPHIVAKTSRHASKVLPPRDPSRLAKVWQTYPTRKGDEWWPLTITIFKACSVLKFARELRDYQITIHMGLQMNLFFITPLLLRQWPTNIMNLPSILRYLYVSNDES